MLRAPHQPVDAATSVFTAALKRSLVPTLNCLSSSPSSPSSNLESLHRLCTLAQSKTLFLLHKTILPNSYRIHSFCSERLLSPLPMFTRLPTKPKGVSSLPDSLSGDSGGAGGKEILVQHLLVKEDDLKLLLDLEKRISEGDDMSDLAVDYSICPSKEEGGMLGWVKRGQMVSEFEEAAFSAPINKVVKCKTKFGWHLLQVLSEREESMLEEIQPDRLHEKLQDPCFLEDAQLIDVREPYEVAQASLPGFQVLPLRQFGSWGLEIATKFDPRKDTYVLCHHGIRSLQVAQWLQTQGFKRVYNVSGGIHAYALKADASIPTY